LTGGYGEGSFLNGEDGTVSDGQRRPVEGGLSGLRGFVAKVARQLADLGSCLSSRSTAKPDYSG
jgi:hypothetical protein